LVLLAVVSVSYASDWPQFRGANRDGKAGDFSAPDTWPQSLTQKWKVTVGEGVATPALVGDKLYVFTRQNSDEVTRCLETETGKEVWLEKYPAAAPNGPAAQFPGPRASPAVADGKVVTLGLNGTLSCVDAATGKKLWRKDDFQGQTPRFYTASSPLITNGLVIAQVGSEGAGGVAAYELASGELKWKWIGEGPGYASPQLMTVGNRSIIVAEGDQDILLLDAADGKILWHIPFAAQGMGAYNASTPIIVGSTLIYSGGGRGTHAIKWEMNNDQLSAKTLWNAEQSALFNSPVVKDGMLYALSGNNELFALSMDSGKVAWTASIAGNAGGGPGMAGGGRPGGQAGGQPGRMGRRGGMGGGRGGYGSIVDAGPVLMALTPSSELVVFAPSDKEFKQLAKIKVASSPTYAYPVVSDNRIFIKDQDSVMLWTVK
jgi:outer membrane protein assembly factor BamB